jgi:thiamine biosynthesis lipoprotein
VVGESVVTSGDYQRFYVDRRGKRRHHLLDPRTGYPAQSGLSSVTVVTADLVAADALSTGLFVAGMRRGLGCLERFPGAEGIFVDLDSNVFVTPGLRDRFRAAAGVGVTILN